MSCSLTNKVTVIVIQTADKRFCLLHSPVHILRVFRCIDYLDLFTSIDTTSISHGEVYADQIPNTTVNWKIQRPADYRICGGLNGLPQKKIYSVGSVLYLVFHSDSNEGSLNRLQYGGFIGQFTFELKERYRTNAVLQPGTRCTYHVEHGSENDEQFRKGNFFSPQFPSNCPPNLHCKYNFTAIANERVVITFQSIRLGFFTGESQPWNALRCSSSYEFHSTSNLIVYDENDNGQLGLLARFCGNVDGVQLVSHGPRLLVEFFSNRNVLQGQGFRGSYEFVHRNQVHPSPYMTALEKNSEKQQMDREHSGGLAADATYVTPSWSYEKEDNQINRTWIMRPLGIDRISTYTEEIIHSGNTDFQKRGSIHSPGYPNRYPISVSKTYTFIGKPHENVFIKFVMLELGDSKSCSNNNEETGDRMHIHDGLTNSSAVITEVCGSPRSLFNQFAPLNHSEPLVTKSSGQYLFIHFHSDSIPGEYEFGFKILYEFQDATSARKQNHSPSWLAVRITNSSVRAIMEDGNNFAVPRNTVFRIQLTRK
ncbi:hypothetical protein PHET_02930 [Paragonimus heterotremus]|uniref:CUB domain-containing protein n=1 Tax=Paragonimus heterotremus TaxID=100268 RepID=A0A8J4TJ26_9TREM|nr:hypothetical protein PHET_02930 [Paragonimus heterotremus]